ncbi:MAG: sigma-70 family RNA polymerase sigma factor [Bacteroidetes bacterium]|nr:sigma-70 family RNA polymerase sigma factor [Bacteroidota bacterium]
MSPDDARTEFMKAYAPCHEPFARYCSALAYGRMDAQDLMQDVLLSAFQRFERIRRKDELLHYLLRAARNRAVSAWRLDRRNADRFEKRSERLKERGASAEMLVDVGILYGALDKLPSAQRDALVLFEVSGLSMAEIAAIQGTNENAVKTRVSRARTTLRSMLEGRARPVRADLLNTLTGLML